MKAQITGRSTTEAVPDNPQHSDAATRALAEAEARRRLREVEQVRIGEEIGGRDGPDPVRYGDWEVRGLASDF